MRQIILEDGKQPQFVGQWSVGEVLAMADALARWVQSLAVNMSSPDATKTQGETQHDINHN